MSVSGTTARMLRKVTSRPAAAWAFTRSCTYGLNMLWMFVFAVPLRSIRFVTMMRQLGCRLAIFRISASSRSIAVEML